MSSLLSSTNSYEIIKFYLMRYFCIVLLILGTFGNTLNICIFTRLKLRSISCSWYFLVATCTNFIALYIGCVTRVLTTFNISPRTTLSSAIYCKFRSYFTYGSLSVSMCLTIGACIDRWALSCINIRIRSITNVKITKRIIISIICIIYLVYSPMFYCYEGIFNSISSNCVTISEAWQLYISSTLFLTYSFLPCCLMLIFGLLTVQNIRNNQQRIAPIYNIQNNRKTPIQLTVMALAQVICLIIFSLPISIQSIYNEVTRNYNKSEEQRQMENFLEFFFVLITFINSAISFYIFTLAGRTFREELKKFLCCKVIIPAGS